jgi:hypothetical protein
VSGSSEAVDELADRLEGVLEELTDMALDALERSVAALRGGSRTADVALDEGAG